MEAQRTVKDDEEQDQLLELIHRIQASGRTELPQPTPEAIARFLARTAQETPLSEEELAEHERMWREVDEEVEALA